MNIALMNERIMIQKSSVVVDEIGNHTSGWSDYYSCACTVGGESGREKEAASQTVDHTDISFTVRYCNKISTLTTDGYRILFHGQTFDIVLIDHMNYKRRSVKIWCRKVGEDEDGID